MIAIHGERLERNPKNGVVDVWCNRKVMETKSLSISRYPIVDELFSR